MPETAIELLVATIEATGGILRGRKGMWVPVADEDWMDLADAYRQACSELGREPMICEESEEEKVVCDDLYEGGGGNSLDEVFGAQRHERRQ